MSEPSEPVAVTSSLPPTLESLDTQLGLLLRSNIGLESRIKRLEARVGAYEAFLDTLASDARFFANAQKKALLEGGSAMTNDG